MKHITIIANRFQGKEFCLFDRVIKHLGEKMAPLECTVRLYGTFVSKCHGSPTLNSHTSKNLTSWFSADSQPGP